MSATYSLLCHDCKVEYWAGQREYIYDPQKIGEFLHDHQNHKLEFTNDLARDGKELEHTLEYKEVEL